MPREFAFTRAVAIPHMSTHVARETIMKINVRRVLSCFVLWSVCLMSPRPARAFALHVWSPQELVNASDVLAVVEVLKPEGAPAPPAGATQPQFALSPQIRVRVLRSFADSPQSAIADGEEIIVNRSRQEITMGETFARGKGWSGPFDRNSFGGLAPGQIVILPLKAEANATQPDAATDTSPAPTDAPEAAVATMWRLAAEGGTGVYVPATRGESVTSAAVTKAKSAIEFLGIEVADSLMSEQVDDRSRAAGYLNDASRGGLNVTNVAPIDVISRRLESEVGTDKARWLDIFTSLYLSTGTPRPLIADLLSDNKKRKLNWNRSFWNLATDVLKRADGDDLEDRLVLNFASNDKRSWAAATALESNYPLHPATLKFFGEGLEEARPESLERVLILLDDAEKDRDHPLVPIALRAARTVLNRPQLEPRGLWQACALIRRFGSEHDLALLIDDFKTSQKTNRNRFRALWKSNRWSGERGFIAIHRIVIRDTADAGQGQRFCDEAAFSLQEAARQNFGWKGTPTLAQRNVIVARARAWLDKNAPPAKAVATSAAKSKA